MVDMKKNILLQTALCALNILFGLIAYRFATFYYVAGNQIYAMIGAIVVIWGIRTIRHWREMGAGWVMLNVLNIIASLPVVLSGVIHIVGVVLYGWYPPF